jgi:hypothetical protein
MINTDTDSDRSDSETEPICDSADIPEEATIAQCGAVVTDGEGVIGYVNPTPEAEITDD